MESWDKESKYIRAKERVEELKKFYGNLFSYVLVISVLAGINYWTNEWRYMWFLWAAFGWGIGVFFHAINTFNLNPFFGKNWEERKINEIMGEDENQNRWE
ncbi:2TM domain-containing protein [Eudoraea chungangensis]|uniref:2TM domain-containing protein n=1 Tax=Eudoraea chungangensis TaxID=1481905 RepID=UPI0023EC054C|nr:2TM domain-containing protein [Eudoraea chungangensis]